EKRGRDEEKDVRQTVNDGTEDEQDEIEKAGGVLGEPVHERLDELAERQFMRRDPVFHHASPDSIRARASPSPAEASLPDRHRPKLFFTASSPGFPSSVVTPASHLSRTAGFFFSHCSAAGPASMLSNRIEPITSFSIFSANTRFLRSVPTFGHSLT